MDHTVTDTSWGGRSAMETVRTSAHTRRVLAGMLCLRRANAYMTPVSSGAGKAPARTARSPRMASKRPLCTYLSLAKDQAPLSTWGAKAGVVSTEGGAWVPSA